MAVIHFRHCERSAAIQGCGWPTMDRHTLFAMTDRDMDRHGLRPRDDKGILVISTFLGSSAVPR